MEAPVPLPVTRKSVRGRAPSSRRGASADAGSVERNVAFQSLRLSWAVSDSLAGVLLPTATSERSSGDPFGKAKPAAALRNAVLFTIETGAPAPSSVKPLP